MAAVAHASISHFETTRLLGGALEDIAATLRNQRSAFASAEPFPTWSSTGSSLPKWWTRSPRRFPSAATIATLAA